MDGKLFRYELKKIGKFPLFIAAGYAAVWLLCGVCSKFGYNSLDYADFFAEIFLYAAFFFAAGNAIWRTAAYDRLYRKVRRDPKDLLSARLLAVAVCLSAVALLFLLLGTAMDLIVRSVRPELTEEAHAGMMFTLYRRSPFYFLVPLSVAMGGVVLVSAAAVPVHAVIGARSPAGKLAAGIFWTLASAAIVACSAYLVVLLPEAPAWGFGRYWAYPMPVDGFTASALRAGAGSGVRTFYACWNVCHLLTLAAGALIVAFAFCAVAFFRRARGGENRKIWPTLAAGAVHEERRRDL